MPGSIKWLLLVVAVLATITGCNPHEVVVTLSSDEIQERVAPHFPLKKNWLIVNVVLRDPKIFLPEGANHIGINMLVEVNVPLLKTIAGQIRATAVPRYDPKAKAFYLDQATVDRLELPGIIPELEGKARSAIESTARQELAKHPIYELKGRNLAEVPGAFTLQEVQVRDGKLRATFGLPI
ncbi:MAG: DUF1439 domain-containing protein [Proteobacteria bacterium]|nr:DUF1439 domain-containing protein [Pseudomonadota bacterium]